MAMGCPIFWGAQRTGGFIFCGTRERSELAIVRESDVAARPVGHMVLGIIEARLCFRQKKLRLAAI